jgi:TolB-like protein/tetratricopeptide (TPR) repeat protein
MDGLFEPIRAFFTELGRRHVIRVAALYAAVAWATIEGASTVLPRLDLPEWSVTLVIVIALFGFPLALVVAWAYDITPDGVRRSLPGRTATDARVPTALLLLVIAIAVFVGFSVRSLRTGTEDGRARTTHEIRSIAVLPFENAGAAADDEYLSEGIAEELLHRLSRVPELRVAARTSSFAFRQGQADVREIGAKLNVDVVLEGSVRSMGDRLRVSARLVSTHDGYQLWSEIYDRETTDIFSMQDEISAAIVERLRPATNADAGPPVSTTQAARATARDDATSRVTSEPESYEAFQLYMRGRYEWNRRTESGLRAAVRYFEQAIAFSPGYARAHHGLADASAVLGFYDYVPPARAFAHARDAAEAALSLDSTLTEAHATLAYVALYHDYDFTAAERGFRHAIGLNPRYAVAHQWYGNLLTAMGRFEQAVREMRVAQQLDPLALIGHAAEGWVSIYARDYDRAIRQLDGVLERDSTYFLAALWKGQALELAGRPADAEAVLRYAQTLAAHSVLAEAALARALALGGRRSDAVQRLAALERRSDREYVSSYEIALIHLALGDTSAALGRLERAAAERAHAIAFLSVDPRLDAIRADPRFQRLVHATRRSAT